MAPVQPTAKQGPAANNELIEKLRHASSSLSCLRELAEQVASLDDPVQLGFCPKQMKTLCTIIDQGRGRIQRRLAILVGPGTADDDGTADAVPTMNISDPATFVAEYRACCRHLCKALNEALRISYAPAIAMLSDFVLRLEKQLWLMDTPKSEPGSDPYRSVSLFLTC
jgi:hypothetical protein